VPDIKSELAVSLAKFSKFAGLLLAMFAMLAGCVGASIRRTRSSRAPLLDAFGSSFDPVLRAAAPMRPVSTLGDHALEAELAGLADQIGAVVIAENPETRPAPM
jgi:hypothetical protein